MVTEIEDADLQDLIVKWNLAQQSLRQVKDLEADLRIQICDKILKGKSVGSHKFLIEGRKLVATKKVSYSLDQFAVNEAYTAGEFEDWEEELIKISYGLRVGDYKKSKNDLTHIDEFITVKDSMPTLEFKDE